MRGFKIVMVPMPHRQEAPAQPNPNEGFPDRGSENYLVPFVAQGTTVQPSLIAWLDDELGELDEDEQLLILVKRTALDIGYFAINQ